MPTKTAFLAFLALLLPGSAWACGGFFCSNAPVLQRGERILFEVPGDGTISVTVDIDYRGAAEDFSWILPVPDTPDLSVADDALLTTLDAATRPVIIPPDFLCTHPPVWNDCDDCDGEASFDIPSPYDGSVRVEGLPQVGPFDPVVVSSDDPDALLQWLDGEGYAVTRAMEPIIAEYTVSGMRFLALKLAPEADVGAITPLRLTYTAEKPSIPLRLTAVGAEPDLRVVVLVAANQRYEPENWAGFQVQEVDVRADAFGRDNNYAQLVGWRADQRGGRAWATELAGGSGEVLSGVDRLLNTNDSAVDAIVELADTFSYFTRLETYISPWEMTDDPVFRPSSGPDVDNVIDLSHRSGQEFCPSQGEPLDPFKRCARRYCGEGECATASVVDGGGSGCWCPDGFAGMAGPLGPTCVPVDADVMETDACAADPDVCGTRGDCLSINGDVACVCDEGTAWIRGQCRPIEFQYGPNRLLADMNNRALGCNGCSTSGAAHPWLWSLLLLPLAALRRRS